MSSCDPSESASVIATALLNGAVKMLSRDENEDCWRKRQKHEPKQGQCTDLGRRRRFSLLCIWLTHTMAKRASSLWATLLTHFSAGELNDISKLTNHNTSLLHDFEIPLLHQIYKFEYII